LHKSEIDCNKITQVQMKQIGHGVGVTFKGETPTPHPLSWYTKWSTQCLHSTVVPGP